MNPKPIVMASIGLTLIAGGATFVALKAMIPQEAQSGVIQAAPERTAKVPPKFQLENQLGEKVSLDQLQGKVVMLTAVYATCHTACPTIITKAKAAAKRLTPEQQADLSIVAITLDPKGDTQDKRQMAAKAHELAPPLFHYVNGDDPEVVLDLIKELGWARAEGPDGVIGHSNLFLLVDRQGTIAFTVSADGEGDELDRRLATLLAEK